jgi:FKBP-type peptidyl-prolyl cis-trans isomerase FklB
MFTRLLNTLVFIAALLSSNQIFAQEEFTLDTDDKKYSYAIGTKIGQQMVQQFGNQGDIDLHSLLQGVISIIEGTDTLLSEEEGNELIQQRHQKQLAEAAAVADDIAAKSREFMEMNKAREGVVTTDSGLQYEVEEAGDDSQASPATTDTVVVHYEGTLIDGTVFDSSYARGEPATFALGSIIPGWQEVLQLMKPGDKWKVVIPPELAYGDRGAGQSIGPNETLLFDIELLEIKKSAN